MTRIGVSGASGYVGAEIVRSLRESGHEVTEFVRAPSTSSERRFVISKSGLEIGQTSDIEVFIHCAWVLSGAPQEAGTLNVQATRDLVTHLSGSDTKLIFISSMASFEEAKSWYGRSKFEAEKIVLSVAGTVVRPGTVFGAKNGGIVGAIERVIRLFHIAPVFGGRGTQLYLVRLDHLCAAIARISASAAEWCGQTLSVVDPPRRPLAELYRTIAKNARTWVLCVPIPGAPCVLGLRLCEFLGLRLPVRSDSIVSIINCNPHEPPPLPTRLAECVGGQSLSNR